MSLFVITDSEDNRWLTYLMNEFCFIQKCNFKIEVIKSGSEVPQDENCIHYTKSIHLKSPWLENKSHSSGEIVETDEFIFLDKTRSLHSHSLFSFDIFWNAFYFVSRKEEFDYEQNGNLVKSYASGHPRKNKNTFTIPIVNTYFELIEKKFTELFPSLSFGLQEPAKIELSHDLDYIKKTGPLLLKQTAMNSWKTLKSISHPPSFLANVSRTVKFLFTRPSYWQFDYWRSIEEKFDQRSIFYVYVHSQRKSLKSRILDPSYDIRKNQDLQIALKDLINRGWRIGVHGSWNSAVDLEVLQNEIAILSHTLSQPVVHGRQHWLRYQESKTPQIHSACLEFDSTIGWNDMMGFRAGTCSQYHPFDHQNQKAFRHLVTPLVIMDSNIFEYDNPTRILERVEKGKRLLNSIKSFKKSHVSINWHPRTRSLDYNWHLQYEAYLAQIGSE